MYRNRKYLDLAKGKPCVMCGEVGTTVAAHYSGEMAQLYGKGISQKPNDFMVAFLCHYCHDRLDTHKLEEKMETLTWFHAIHQTIQMLLETGEIEINVL